MRYVGHECTGCFGIVWEVLLFFEVRSGKGKETSQSSNSNYRARRINKSIQVWPVLFAKSITTRIDKSIKFHDENKNGIQVQETTKFPRSWQELFLGFLSYFVQEARQTHARVWRAWFSPRTHLRVSAYWSPWMADGQDAPRRARVDRCLRLGYPISCLRQRCQFTSLRTTDRILHGLLPRVHPTSQFSVLKFQRANACHSLI